MSILHDLFVPKGLTHGGRYWTGCAILFFAGVAIQALPLVIMSNASGFSGIMMGAASGILLWLLIYPYVCLFGKRLRDAGASPWFFLLALLAYVVASQIASFIAIIPLMSEMSNDIMQQSQNMQNGTPQQNMEQMTAMQVDMMKKMLPIQIVVTGIVTIIIDVVIGLLPRKLEGNIYRDDYSAEETFV